jgi:beta-xylosidase
MAQKVVVSLLSLIKGDRIMKKYLAFLSLVICLLVACTGIAKPNVEITKPPLPTDTSIPPIPTSTVSPLLFRDDFDGALATGWQWLHEDPTHWNLNEAPGYLRIIVQPSSINGERIRNFLVREAPKGNFEIATLLRFTPTKNFQIAGLLVYQEQSNALQFGRAFSECSTGCSGNAIYFDSFQAGNFGPSNFATKVNNASQAYLRLRRVGNTYTGYYSEDANTWLKIGEHESSITPSYVGLIGAQGFEGEAPADFDYFTIEVLP